MRFLRDPKNREGERVRKTVEREVTNFVIILIGLQVVTEKDESYKEIVTVIRFRIRLKRREYLILNIT